MTRSEERQADLLMRIHGCIRSGLRYNSQRCIEDEKQGILPFRLALAAELTSAGFAIDDDVDHQTWRYPRIVDKAVRHLRRGGLHLKRSCTRQNVFFSLVLARAARHLFHLDEPPDVNVTVTATGFVVWVGGLISIGSKAFHVPWDQIEVETMEPRFTALALDRLQKWLDEQRAALAGTP
jgi:hypothetical protein